MSLFRVSFTEISLQVSENRMLWWQHDRIARLQRDGSATLPTSKYVMIEKLLKFGDGYGDNIWYYGIS